MIAAWMVYACVVALLFGAAALVGERLVAAHGGARRWVWGAAMLAAVLVPLVRGAAPQRLPVLPPAPAVAGDETPAAFAMPAWHVAAPRVDADGVLLTLWGVMSALLALRLLYGQRRAALVRRAARRGRLAGTDVLLAAEGGPAVVGLREMEIVVPHWLRDFDEGLQRIVLRHEDEHRRARDPWLISASALCVVLVPWNVVLWWQAARLRRAIELDCDARVLRAHPGAERYGRLLLTIAQRRGSGAAVLTPALVEPVTHLEARIMEMQTDRRLPRGARMLLTGVMAGAAVLACTAERPVAPAATGVSPEILAAQARRDATIHVQAPGGTSTVTDPANPLPPGVKREFEVDRPAALMPGSPGPLYPPAQKAARVEGSVLVSFVVQASGEVDPSTVRIIRATNEEFAAVVRTTVPRFRFRPAQVDGRDVPQLVQQPVVFSLSR